MLLANKLIEKMPDPRNAEEHSIICKKEKHKLIKTIKNYFYQPKILENSNIVYMNIVIAEHPKISHKLSKTIRQAEKVGSNSSSYTIKSANFLNEKKK